MRLLLIRHAQSSANAERRLQGHLDVPLSERGLRESALLAERLAQQAIDVLYTSPLQRARQTAEVVAARLGLDLVERPALIERDVGELAGLTRDEIMERYPHYVPQRLDTRPEIDVPGFENDAEFRQRVLAVLHEIIERHTEGTVAVVTHGGVIGAFCRETLQMPPNRPAPFAIGNTSVSSFDVRDGGFDESFRPRIQLIALNDTCHLDALRD
ncbi:MAG: histidine phosphatase family protein [Dehalococcoidia bacterium]